MKSITVLLALVCLFQRHEAADNSCPEKWTKNGDSGSCYYVSDDYASFDVAKEKCESQKSELVPFLTADTELQLNSLLIPLRDKCDEYGNCVEFWIGVRDFIGNNTWTTTKGIPINKQIQFWALAYPKFSGRCVLMSFEDDRNKGVWKNEHCGRPLRFVCVSCPSGFEYLSEAKGCFKVITQKQTWDQGTEACRSIAKGAHLAAITSAAKQNAIANYLKTKFEVTSKADCNPVVATNPWWHQGLPSYWISGQTADPYRCGTPLVWKTLEGLQIPFNYTNWIKGEPSCSDGQERCVEIVTGYNYAWNDMRCHIQTCSLCEI